ncbi:MAG: hypothetical protein AAGA25_12370 [Planctomycetota bacterium]
MRDDSRHPDPAPLGQIDPRESESTDTSWMAPDPPPIPDRIRKKVEPTRPNLPPIPKVRVKVDHRWLRYGFMGGGAIVLGLVLALLLRGSPFTETARAQWQDLCTDYAKWFSPLASSIEHQDKTVLRDVGLGAVVDILADAEKFDPRFIADRPGSNLAAIGQEPPATAKTKEAIRATSQASAALARIEAAFAKWPTIVALESHHVLFKDHGWDRAAEFVELHLKDAPPYGKAPVSPTLIKLQSLEAQTTSIAHAVELLEEELAVLAPHNDPVFDSLAQAVRDLDRQPPTAPRPQANGDAPYSPQLAGLNETLNALEAFANRFRLRVESEEWAAIDHARFRETGRAYSMLAQGNHKHSDIFRTWLAEVDNYRGVAEEDWRPDWAKQQRETLAQTTEPLRKLQDADHLTAKPLANRIEELHSRIDAVLDAPHHEGIASELQIQRNLIERDVRDTLASAHKLEQSLRAQQTADQLRATTPLIENARDRSPAIENAWLAERQRLAQKLEKDNDLAAATTGLETVRETLLALNAPDSPQSLPPAATFDLNRHDFDTAKLLEVLQTRSAEQRQATFAVALSDGLPIDTTRWSKLQRGYAKQLVAAEQLADLASRIEQAIAGAYALDDPAVTSAEGGLASEVLACKQSGLMRDPAVAEAAKPVLTRIEAIDAVTESFNRWESLNEAAAQAQDPALAFAMWRHLAKVDWPGHSQTLRAEIKLQQRLSKLARDLQKRDRKRGQALANELTAAQPERWLLAMNSATDQKEIRAISALAEDMNVDIQGLPMHAQFNVRLHRMQSALGTLPTAPGPQRDAEILTIARAFSDQLRAIDENPKIMPVVDSLDTLTAQDASPREVLADAGPGGRGWEVQPHDDGGAVTFTRGNWALTFVRIDPPRGDPFYLCTIELPVGLVLDLAKWDNVEDELLAVMPQRGDEDTRKGPSVWVHGESSLELNPRNWLRSPAAYLNDLTPSPPRPDYPINYVTAEGASYLAARLGCRLPTVAQWTTAMQRFPVPPRSVPNLRDTTWARHAQHVSTLIQAGAPGIDWANSDVFRPATNTNTADPVGNFHPINDATLWFKPLPRHDDASAKPIHLVGNLAELVTLSPIDPTPLINNESGIEQRRDAFRRTHKNDFAVLGASALSPASLNPTAPQPFNVFIGAKGYADVGIRLAFEVPIVSPARQAELALKNQPYLTP